MPTVFANDGPIEQPKVRPVARMTNRGPRNPERSFGFSVGLVLCAGASLLAWRGRFGPAEATGVVGLSLIVLARVRPTLLKWPSAIWWRCSQALAYVNVRVLLTVVFAVVLAPLGLAWRLGGKDPLARRRQTWTGWSPYPVRYRDRKHYERMF